MLVTEQSDFEHNGIIKTKRHLDFSFVLNPEIANPGIDVWLPEGVETFVGGAVRMQGGATSIDLPLMLDYVTNSMLQLCWLIIGDLDQASPLIASFSWLLSSQTSNIMELSRPRST